MLSSGSAPRASNASVTLSIIITTMTATRMNSEAANSGSSTTTWFTCWMSVFARAMSWPVCALVVEREVQALQVREQALAEIGLDAERDPERRVATCPRPHCLHGTHEHDEQRVDDDRAAVARQDAVVDGSRGEQRDRDLGRGPDHAREHARDDPSALAAERTADEPPPGSSQLALPIQRPLPLHGSLAARRGYPASPPLAPSTWVLAARLPAG